MAFNPNDYIGNDSVVISGKVLFNCLEGSGKIVLTNSNIIVVNDTNDWLEIIPLKHVTCVTAQDFVKNGYNRLHIYCGRDYPVNLDFYTNFEWTNWRKTIIQEIAKRI